MQFEPWFSHEVGKDFRKWENGGLNHYHELGEGRKRIVSRLTGLAHRIFVDEVDEFGRYRDEILEKYSLRNRFDRMGREENCV